MIVTNGKIVPRFWFALVFTQAEPLILLPQMISKRMSHPEQFLQFNMF